ncbi:hypothetical protein BC936DRAFT_146454 [Jimgerdemannia flammicorona]|uniref:RING-type domain-containing protein n=1 Tax=Jimgerdemannia flammicorona TaxID=994334 RepID=A0A433D7P0_9FUNG|nr:hypothetical protein BC936DRAFT_146454 [Jimgerdemannia flammicorona]
MFCPKWLIYVIWKTPIQAGVTCKPYIILYIDLARKASIVLFVNLFSVVDDKNMVLRISFNLVIAGLLLVCKNTRADNAPVEIHVQEMTESSKGAFYNANYGYYSILTGPYLIPLIPYQKSWGGLLVNFNISCPNMTTYDTILAANFLSSPIDSSYLNQPKIALVRRGGCPWSQKIDWAMSLSIAHSMNVAGVIIADNQSTGNMTVATLNNGTVFLNASDNDIQRGKTGPIPAIFVDDLLGVIFYQGLAATFRDEPVSFLQLTITFATSSTQWNTIFNVAFGSLLIFISALLYYHFGRRYGWNPFKWRKRVRLERLRWEARHQRNHMVQLRVLMSNEIDNIPIVAYDPEKIKNPTCPICLEDYTELQSSIPDNDKVERCEGGAYMVRELPCGHGFCIECIEGMLSVTPMVSFDA